MKRTGLAVSFALLLAGIPHPPAFGWVTGVVDRLSAGGNGGEGSSIAVDSTGAIHVASLNRSKDGVQYTTNASGAWETILLDQVFGGSNTSIAVDSGNKVHIAYKTINGLQYATNASGSWVTTLVDVEVFWPPGLLCSIAVDTTNKVHICHHRTIHPMGLDHDLRYVTNASGVWAKSTVETDAYYHSVSVDSSGKVHMSYTTIDGLQYATNTSGVWVKETVDPSGAGSTSIAMDGVGRVHISYPATEGLKHATNASGPWVIETVDTGGGTPSMAVDGSNNLHIAYKWNGIRYATNLSGAWRTETVVANGEDPSIAVESSDRLHVSYATYDSIWATLICHEWIGPMGHDRPALGRGSWIRLVRCPRRRGEGAHQLSRFDEPDTEVRHECLGAVGYGDRWPCRCRRSC